eukprot:COSAG02_NODE_5969_length_3902_cov_3.156455_3_plen_77_part_00
MSQNGLHGHSHKSGVARGYRDTGALMLPLPTTALDNHQHTDGADEWLSLSLRAQTVTLAVSSILTWSEKTFFKELV